MRVHDGSEEQLADALIEAIEGAGNAPAYRGTAYVVIENMDLTPFGSRIPALSFEVVRSVDAEGEVPPAAELIEGVALVPGTGEYALATTQVHYRHGGGEKDSANVNTDQGAADFAVTLRDLTEELPNLRSVSLVVSWFGNDLRCGACEIRPRVEQVESEGHPMPWRVAGLNRNQAGAVPRLEGRPVYGGTPADASVIEAIRASKAAGLAVTFYPFILMDQLAGNGLPDPWGGDEQAALPWRGRITTDLAPGTAGSADGAVAADAQVAAFFGGASAADFATSGGRVNGPDEPRYRRFILHYAHLCALAGGVEAFCIGSEMRALTQIRGANGGFPAVAALVELAAEVRAILPDAKISYAADWTEYSGYQPADTGDRHFHLDPLWADENIDFIGIDNYMPLSDWRDGTEHLDADRGPSHSLDYLQAGIEGGEGYDWYYPTPEARAAQRRVPITDGAHGEPWVWRFKDLRSFWSKPHFERLDGQRQTEPTAWVPQSKPIRFTEYGCAAIDKGANQPNKFLDPKSSESELPYASDGRRDDAMQMQYLRATLDYWRKAANNPTSSFDGRPMIDLAGSLAWAWDTRPWPAFPELSDFWTDAENYPRGHWISGRSAALPLASVLKALCAQAGVTRVDVSGVHGVLRGYTMSDVQNGRANLQPLMLAHGVEAREAGGCVVFSMRALAPARDIDSTGLVREGEDAVLSLQRAPEAETAGRVRVTHMDAAGDFEVRVGDATQAGARQVPVTETELPLALTRGEGHALAERFLSESRVARDSLTLRLSPSRREIEVGDLLRLDGGPDLWRVDRIEDRGARKVEAIRTERGLYEASDAVEDGSGRIRPLAPLPVDPIFMDLPRLTAESTVHAPYVAVAARPWPGSVALHSGVEDADYRLNRVIDAPSRVGRTETVLERARPAVWDEGPELHLRLAGAALSTVSETAVLAGANATAIGDGSVNGWELFQFREAVLIGPDLWALRGRLRGQRGTEPLMRDPWPIGSQVVILDGGPQQIELPRDALGLARHYRAGPARFPVDHESYIHEEVTVLGEGLKPYAPVHLRLEVDAGARLSWIRRTRAITEGWGAGDVPLEEARERYLVRLFDGGGAILLEEQVVAPEWRATAARWAGLRANEGLRFTVAQISDEVGPGRGADLIVT
uniref:baseplate multidomain protein megatron n=1 Tax=Jannaschia ovalis TaxID=3038773 RepID=UPI0032639252